MTEGKNIRCNYIRCNYIKCYAGMGVAGNGICFLDGNPANPKCKKFIDEDEELKRQEKYCVSK
jgi:hypothetical protein